ncbi:unnamed protein product [Sphagnum jensenii]|uniref:Uncharacterized protein n=1 Tax=Sphagnum jensenii TaxID=128206 RepID=A0ABP1B594_9BRYO
MGSTSTALGAGTSPVSAFTAGVFLGVGISIVAMGRLLQYVYEMGQRSSVAGDRANAETNEHDQANGIASSSSGDQTATTSTDVATLLLSPQNSEVIEVIVQSPPISSPDEITTSSTAGSFLAPTNVVAFEVAPSEFASTSSGHQPATHFTMADVFVATYSMLEDLISFASSF